MSGSAARVVLDAVAKLTADEDAARQPSGHALNDLLDELEPTGPVGVSGYLEAVQ